MMMNNNNNTYSNSSSSLAKDEELQKFESSFFPAGGSAKLANIPQAPPAPTNLNNVKSKPMNLKTRNWGPKLENGFSGLNRSLYDKPNSSTTWDQRPLINERSHLNSNVELSSFPSSSSSTSTTSTSRSVIDNIPQALSAPRFRDLHHHHIHGKRLRIRNWGYPTVEGWSGMNRDLYNAGMTLERNVLLNELRYKYGPRPTFQQERSTIVETVPTTTTTLVETGPAKVLATTVPVPMLNPPINDGRRYAKLYKRNTNALASEKGVSKLVKRRGTRRDHLVQPNTTTAPLTSGFSTTPYVGATVIQPATLVSETRTVLPSTGVVTPLSTLAPTPALPKSQMKTEKRAMRDQQKFVKKEQRAARKANKKNSPVMSAPMFATAAPVAPLFTTTSAPVATTTRSYVAPLQTGIIAQPTTTLVSSPALQTAAFPSTTLVGTPATFVGETRSVLTQDATLIAPTTTIAAPLPATTTAVLTPVGVSAQPLDHSHVLAGQLGNAPVKRPRRARKAKKGTEQPLYSNVISTTPAPLAAVPITTGVATMTTATNLVEGTTVVQPATLVSETRNILVDPLVGQQQGMIKQEYMNVAPAISPLATGNPIM